MNRAYLIFCSIIILFSCTKIEGEGGLASIEGVVVIQNVNSMLEEVGNPIIAKDEDVFISYGDNTLVDDDVVTSPTGNFKFDYLMPGNYSIFVYSDDTAAYNSQNQMIVKKKVSISDKKENAKLDTIVIYKFVDYNDGTSSISGIVHQYEYFDGTTVKMDSIPAQNVDVFLKFANDDQILDRYRTSYDGSYKIINLIPGSYTLFVLSEQAYLEEKEVIMYNFEITGSNKRLVADTLKISNF